MSSKNRLWLSSFSCLVSGVLLLKAPTTTGQRQFSRPTNYPVGTVPLSVIASNSGGTLTAASSTFNPYTTENPLLPPPLIMDTREGYGAWKSTGHDSNQFAVTFNRFLFAGVNTSTAVHRSFLPGQYVGKTTVQQRDVYRHATKD